MNPYKILNIPQDSSLEVVKKAYKKLALVHHPDKGGNSNTFLKIKEAYEEILSGGKNTISTANSTEYHYTTGCVTNVRVKKNKDYEVHLDLYNIRYVDIINDRYTIKKRHTNGYITLNYEDVIKHCASNGKIIINVYYNDEYNNVVDFSSISLNDPRTRFQRFLYSLKNIF